MLTLILIAILLKLKKVKMDKVKLYKNIGLVIWIIVTLFLGYQFFKPNVNTIDDKFLNARIDTLEKEKKVLIGNVIHRDSLNAIDKKMLSIYELREDSLLNVISKNKNKYNGEFTKANNATANVLVSEFTNIFTDNNIR